MDILEVFGMSKVYGGLGTVSSCYFAKSLAAKNVWNIIHGSGLWVKIVVQKYIHPMTILDWIRSPIKLKRCMSICWKAVLWDFDIIQKNLVWKIGNGVVVRIGVDPWIGCKWIHALPSSMIEKFHLAGFSF